MGTTVTASERQKKINEVQEARRAARKAKRLREPVVALLDASGVNFGDAPLHALFAKCKATIAANYRSINPVSVVRKSAEYRRAVALCSAEKAESKLRESGLIK